MKLRYAQRQHIADKLMDSANLGLGGLVFGQLIARTIDVVPLLLGLSFYGWAWSVTLILKREVKRP